MLATVIGFGFLAVAMLFLYRLFIWRETDAEKQFNTDLEIINKYYKLIRKRNAPEVFGCSRLNNIIDDNGDKYLIHEKWNGDRFVEDGRILIDKEVSDDHTGSDT